MNNTALKCALLSMATILSLVLPAFPTAGIGVQYGYDLSLSLPDKIGEQASLTDLSLNTSSFGGTPPADVPTTISGKDLPIFINRTGWTRNWFDVGGKVYIDCIPIIDALELSTNYAMWEYQGQIIYPTSITFHAPVPPPVTPAYSSSLDGIAQINYDTSTITMKNLGLSNPFVQNTPYAKLQFDLTARKYILSLPPITHTIRIYGGAGMSMFFATPLLSANLIEKAIGNTLTTIHSLQNLQSQAFGNLNVEQDIAKEFMKELFTSHRGAHLDLGAMVKFPLMPFGIYVDCKYLVPFGPMDPNVTALKSNGLLFNGGIAFTF